MGRTGLTFVFAALLALAVASCDCGGGPGTGALGAACTDGSQCESGLCGPQQKCIASSPRPDSGGGSGDPGNDGGGLPVFDAGPPCDGLQCQIQRCADGGTTTVIGKVYDPAGAVPLYNAIVYVPNRPLLPFAPGPSCDSCGAQVSGSPVAITLSEADGTFKLTGVPSGTDIPLVVQIGKWRRKVLLPAVAACQPNPLTDANLTRLPRNRAEGDLPQIAIATGEADAFECLLRKIGISDSEITRPDGGGRVHYYVENGLKIDGGAPDGSVLWGGDGGTLMQYDVTILPCEGAPNAKSAPAVQNLVRYTNAGGRLFTTHFGYVWTQPGWPQAADWRPRLADLYNSTFNVTVDRSFPKGQAFSDWLYNVGASVDAGSLPLFESRHDVVSVNPGSTRWLYGDIPAANPQGSIQHLTFNTPFLDGGSPGDGGTGDGGTAAQCGRVVYSDFHVTAGATDGGGLFPGACKGGPLTGQEKALEFMLFDLSSCVQDDSQKPTACSGLSQGCGKDGDCCLGLVCRDANAGACTNPAAGCACQIKID